MKIGHKLFLMFEYEAKRISEIERQKIDEVQEKKTEVFL